MSIHVKVQVKLNLYTNRYGHRPWRSIDQRRAFFPLASLPRLPRCFCCMGPFPQFEALQFLPLFFCRHFLEQGNYN